MYYVCTTLYHVGIYIVCIPSLLRILRCIAVGGRCVARLVMYSSTATHLILTHRLLQNEIPVHVSTMLYQLLYSVVGIFAYMYAVGIYVYLYVGNYVCIALYYVVYWLKTKGGTTKLFPTTLSPPPNSQLQ